ncbi:hypothetical protein [Legionella pneumophila]|nr:hypothetical protein [Legionella pneumophila]WAI75062.1 hypothetical protein OXA91_08420 [Legionella pneumophila]
MGWAPSEFSKDPYAEPKVVSEDKAESEEENEDEESRNSASV